MSLNLIIIGAVALVLALLLVKRLIGGSQVANSVVLDKIKSGATIIDVRTSGEFRDGAYTGSINIPLAELDKRLKEIPKDKPVVLYCQSGARSAAATRALKKAGYTDVVNAGGLTDMPPLLPLPRTRS
jgi:phage shock protein E